MALTTSVDTVPLDGATTKTDSPEDKRRGRRRARYEARAILWRESQLKRVQHCGRFASGDAVTVRASGAGSERNAGFGGVQSCGSVWACPCCSEKINAERQAELQQGITTWLEGRAEGQTGPGSVLFATFTVQHNKGHALADLWDAISPAFNRMTSGSTAWRGGKRTVGDKAFFGIAGYVRLVETKHGANGWHPHVHMLMFCERQLTDAEVEQLRSRMFGRWSAALGKAGLRSLEFDKDGHAVGADIRRVHDGEYIAEYFAKNGYRPAGTAAAGAAYEVTGSHSKQAGKGGRTPFQILSDVVTVGDADDLDRWHEWERVSKGRRQLTWSRGLRDLLGLNPERTDEQIVEDDNDGETLARVSAGQYRQLARTGRLCDVLEAAEQDDAGCAVIALLHGYGFRDVRVLKKRREPSLFAA